MGGMDAAARTPRGQPDTASGVEAARGIVMVEGLPGSGKSTTAEGLASWLGGGGAVARHWPEGRPDHPVDFEHVSLLSDEAFRRLHDEDPTSWREISAHAERFPDAWLIRHTDQLALPDHLTERMRSLDAYDGAVSPELHARVLSESWRRHGSQAPEADVQIWECVLIQNPVCAFIARFDQPAEVLAAHVQGLVATVRDHRPVLVYLDPGDPEVVLRRVAAERPDWWLDFVIRYHTGQGYGLRRGLEGFDGYVEFMRMRRSLELELLPRLDLPILLISTADESPATTAERVRDFVREQLVA